MPSRSSADVKRFRRAANLRLAEASLLLDHDYTTVAVYLAGYAVECALKALLLANIPKSQRSEILTTFRGQKAHDFQWLQYRLRQQRLNIPTEVLKSIVRLGTDWSTDLRYSTHKIWEQRANGFLLDARTVMEWAQRSS